ncbi:MAG: type II secretion system F family protein [Lachnospiraceae bacterium]|nr:type II secretion system F family protein [Lachnospiraceae bacterium]
MRPSSKLPDYKYEDLSGRESLICILQGAGLMTVFGYFFYKSVYAVLFLLPLVYPYYKYRTAQINGKRRKKLVYDFKEAVKFVSYSLEAGYSLENAFVNSIEEMGRLYKEETDILAELRAIRAGLDNNRTLSSLLQNLAMRSGEEDISNLVMILSTGKKMGGNMKETIHNYLEIMEEKTALEMEIDMALSSRRYELKIMSVIPFLIILYVDVSNRGLLDPLYHNPVGIVIMTVMLGVYCLAIIIAEKIMKQM